MEDQLERKETRYVYTGDGRRISGEVYFLTSGLVFGRLQEANYHLDLINDEYYLDDDDRGGFVLQGLSPEVYHALFGGDPNNIGINTELAMDFTALPEKTVLRYCPDGVTPHDIELSFEDMCVITVEWMRRLDTTQRARLSAIIEANN